MSSLQAAAKPNTPVVCTVCGHEFVSDPCFMVECPLCHALPNHYCKRPSEHSGPFVAFHAERDLEALRAGFYDHCNPETGEICGKQSSDVAKESTKSGVVEEVIQVEEARPVCEDKNFVQLAFQL